MLPIPQKDFVSFLIKAKKSTYAATENSKRVDPLLDGSVQYEFRQGSLLYRDVYFGMAYFTGQEIVYYSGVPIWGMSYAGGVSQGILDKEMKNVYAFLGQALREIPIEAPFRGPKNFEENGYTYSNHILGNIERFSGTETILQQGLRVYQLHYSGGIFG